MAANLSACGWRANKGVRMKQAEMLETFRKTGALLNGHFELRSGLHSDEYFQCALLLQYPAVAEKLCAALVEKMRLVSGGRIVADGVISPAMGGLFVGHEIARALSLRHIFAEKEAGQLVLRRGFEIKKGEKLVVAEDVVTRGGRVQETIDIVEKAGGIVSAIVVLVNRSGGKASFKQPFFSLLEMEPVTYEPAACPLCKRGEPMIHPGSKSVVSAKA